MSKRTLRILFAVLGLAVLAAAGLLYYGFRPVSDYGAGKPDVVFQFDELIDKVTRDTASLHNMKDQVVGVRGTVKTLHGSAASLTVEIGTDTGASSIVCQIDPRHAGGLSGLKAGQPVALQGRMVGYTTDTLFGLGSTVEMNYCAPMQQAD